MSKQEPQGTSQYVLDSWAILAHLGEEPGHERIKELLREAGEGDCVMYMTWVNLGEVLYIVERERGLSEAQNTLAHVLTLPVEWVAADRDLVLAAAHFKAQMPIAYADCFALALAQLKGAKVVTGDPEFAKAEPAVSVEWLGARENGKD